MGRERSGGGGVGVVTRGGGVLDLCNKGWWGIRVTRGGGGGGGVK